MKVCFFITKLYNEDTIFIPLTFILSLIRGNELYCIFVNESVKMTQKNILRKIKIKENIKNIIEAQTGINFNNLTSVYDLLYFLKNKYYLFLKVCNTSAIIYGISRSIGDNKEIEEIFELTTAHDITAILSNCDKVFYF
jgi:sulfur relay (sulfurtransferase) complex TusBCD TusD component (DsrE family)